MLWDVRNGIDKEHEWILPAHKKVLDNYWETDPKWKNRSKKPKENRLSVAGGFLHCGGSVTQASTIDRMTKELGRIPTHEEVFIELHTRKGDKSKWVDKHSQDTHV
ncbi:hypothetical protein PIB30_067517 [Stylosanthes scabra]|uniref:Uncharacterized protein n=1 Tax=Stylosanthes scabra TaxID=79078 RepID=A0ABU6WL20_9FABA|nr:hypothetical protein [Stylosanthes scabra]